MNSNQTNAQNPMSEYLLKLQLIVNNAEFKNKTEANKYETLETKQAGDEYVRAMTKTDMFEYYTYDPKEVYKVMDDMTDFSDQTILSLIQKPHMIPQSVKNVLLERMREHVIANYVERNKYYVMLTGNPFPGSDDYPAEDDVLVPEKFYKLYKDDSEIEKNMAIHDMPYKYQELFINSPYYAEVLKANPTKEYLKYLGSNAIPIHISRPAKDGDILRINMNKLSTYHDIFGNVNVSADIIHTFIHVYNETRDYVYFNLRGNFNDIYPNYDSFIRFLTIYMAIGSVMNEFMKQSTSMLSMNGATANNFFMLYGLPSVIMGGQTMIEFLKKFRLLLMDKGTNVVYRVKDLIGYEYTDIYTLVMVKQQIFQNGIPVYHKDDDGNLLPKQEIVFRRLGTTDDNTSYFKYRESTESYTVEEITSGDPRWWNTPEVEQMLQDMNYTLSNSKYIQLSTHLSMTDIWWQCVILLRGLLDNKNETMFTSMNININIDGESNISIFEAVLVLVVLMNWHLKDNKGYQMNGNMYLPNGMYDGKEVCLDLLFNGLNDDGSPKDLVLGLPYKLTSFDFRIRENKPDFYNSIKDLDYIEPDIFLPMLNSVLNRESNNVGEVLMTDVKLIYKYLETKLRLTQTVHEFRQVTDVFSNLFLVDPVRNWYDNESFNIDQILMETYDITIAELNSLKNFFKQDDEPQFSVVYKNITYPISLYYVLNASASDYEINNVYPFRDEGFITAFTHTLTTYNCVKFMLSAISSGIKNNYKSIILDKIILDTGDTVDGPKTFESLLFRTNSSIYRYLISIKDNSDAILFLMRDIIRALEEYTNSNLSALEFKVIGVDEYFHILKEVISYFKSYMVEYTKDEFVYLFDGLWDCGGNSNMLKLFDEITSGIIEILAKSSLTMFDVSSADMYKKFGDDCRDVMYDEAIFRIQGTYGSLLNTGFEIGYDDGKRITSNPLDIDTSTKVTASIIPTGEAYKIIININNLDVIPPNYIGNSRPIK